MHHLRQAEYDQYERQLQIAHQAEDVILLFRSCFQALAKSVLDKSSEVEEHNNSDCDWVNRWVSCTICTLQRAAHLCFADYLQDAIQEASSELQRQPVAASCLLGTHLLQLVSCSDAFTFCMRALPADPRMRMSVYAALLQVEASHAIPGASLDYLSSHVLRDLRRHPLTTQPPVASPPQHCLPHLPSLLRLAAAVFSTTWPDQGSGGAASGLPDEASVCSSNGAAQESVRSARACGGVSDGLGRPQLPPGESGDCTPPSAAAFAGAPFPKSTALQPSSRALLGMQIARTLCEIFALVEDPESLAGSLGLAVPLEGPSSNHLSKAEQGTPPGALSEAEVHSGAAIREQDGGHTVLEDDGCVLALCVEHCSTVLHLVEAALEVLVALPEQATQALGMCFGKEGRQLPDGAPTTLNHMAGQLLWVHKRLGGVLELQRMEKDNPHEVSLAAATCHALVELMKEDMKQGSHEKGAARPIRRRSTPFADRQLRQQPDLTCYLHVPVAASQHALDLLQACLMRQPERPAACSDVASPVDALAVAMDFLHLSMQGPQPGHHYPPGTLPCFTREGRTSVTQGSRDPCSRSTIPPSGCPVLNQNPTPKRTSPEGPPWSASLL
eukprot:jgi/Botrbrau1/9983/Bobra.0012s0074.1